MELNVLWKGFTGLIVFPLELSAGLAVYCFPLKKRGGLRKRLLFMAVMFLLWIFCLEGAELLLYGRFNINSAATLFFASMLFLFMIALVRVCCDVSFVEAVYCTACAYLTEHMAYCIRILAGCVCGAGMIETGSALYFFIFAAVYTAAFFLFSRKMVQDKHYGTSIRGSVGLMMATLFVVLFMSVAATVYGFEPIHAVYALFCCFFVLAGQVKQQRQLMLLGELGLQRQLWMKHKAQYETAKENIEIINRKCHDLKHQVAALRRMEDPDERREALDTIEESVMIYDSMLETGNEILDTVLTEKSVVCARNHIAMNCMADGKLLAQMDTVDLYTMFGNALDNAIEAVQKLEAPEERCIGVTVRKKAGLVLVQVENRYEGSIQFRGQNPVSQKEDSSCHGFGIKSIRYAAEKYNGFVTIETAAQMFVLRITIPEEGLSQAASKK